MILIGMLDSPFVRRVAVSLNLLEVPFEHKNWSVGTEFELIRQFNPLGRVPTLVQPDGESLIDSSAILDFLDESAEQGALLPRSGQGRRVTARGASAAATRCTARSQSSIGWRSREAMRGWSAPE